MALRMMLLAGLASGLSMCATQPQEAADDPLNGGQVGPDGLVVRTAPTDAIESGTLPDPGAGAQPAEES